MHTQKKNALVQPGRPVEYELSLGQAAIVTEIYLPAKYAISSRFLAALEDSLSSERVRKYFEDDWEEETKNFLPKRLRNRYADLRNGIKTSQRSFGGYSVYDLKGAWTGTMEQTESDANVCIRIIDWPDPDKLFPPNPSLCWRVIRTVFALRLHHDDRPDISSLLRVEKEAVDEICKALDKWIDEGSFLLYGFLMHHLAQITGGHESEILLTSHFAVVHQYSQAKQSSLSLLRDASGHVVSTVVRTGAHTGAVDISKEGAVSSSINCYPDKIVMKPSQWCVVAVILEDEGVASTFSAFGYNKEVVEVEPPSVNEVFHGVADFTITAKKKGVTNVGFGVSGAKTCVCKIIVTEATPKPQDATPRQ